MQTNYINQTLSRHNARVRYQKTPAKVFFGGILTGALIGLYVASFIVAQVIIK